MKHQQVIVVIIRIIIIIMIIILEFYSLLSFSIGHVLSSTFVMIRSKLKLLACYCQQLNQQTINHHEQSKTKIGYVICLFWFGVCTAKPLIWQSICIVLIEPEKCITFSLSLSLSQFNFRLLRKTASYFGNVVHSWALLLLLLFLYFYLYLGFLVYTQSLSLAHRTTLRLGLESKSCKVVYRLSACSNGLPSC